MIIELAKQLIARASVTPEDAGCQQLIAEQLEACGFTANLMRFEEVDNVWLTHGQGSPVLTFLGHTDVVPAGPLDEWQGEPFQPQERDGMLYGRGAADMKGSVAAMTVAMQRFVTAHPQHKGTLSMLLTSDEEGRATNGTRRVVEHLQENNLQIDWCLVGEPSSQEHLGDVIKVGRRGSLRGQLIVRGKQGHTAYPQLADNPVHRLAPALLDLTQIQDEGDEHYPPGSLQVSNIHAGTGAGNVIPGSVEVDFNMRFSPQWTETGLKKEITAILERHRLDYQCHWQQPVAQPFLTPGGKLLDAVRGAIKQVCGIDATSSTAGGTSDGRFIAPTGAEVVELGPLNATIHQVNECVSSADLQALGKIYEAILTKLLTD
ncbi:MAG: succinyl-diaminopimelate desuccinylase [Gammaproteobacteria bacterium]